MAQGSACECRRRPRLPSAAPLRSNAHELISSPTPVGPDALTRTIGVYLSNNPPLPFHSTPDSAPSSPNPQEVKWPCRSSSSPWPVTPARGTAPAMHCHPGAGQGVGTGGLAGWSPWPCGRFVHQGTCAVVESHARAVANVALAYLKAHLCPHPDLPRPYLPLASPMHPHLCVGPKGAPHRSLAWPQPRPLSASWPRAKAEAEAAHAAIDPPVGYREGGSRVGSLTEVRAVRAPQVNEFLATRKRWRRS
jgi:hypothetical protein